MNHKHFLSEPAIWSTHSEFVSPNGAISTGQGESEIAIKGTSVTNISWVQLGGKQRKNSYTIEKVSENQYNFKTINPELGKQYGTFHIDRNVIYSRFEIDDSGLNGFEIITRHDDNCLAMGALYKGDHLINSWKTVMNKKTS